MHKINKILKKKEELLLFKVPPGYHLAEGPREFQGNPQRGRRAMVFQAGTAPPRDTQLVLES